MERDGVVREADLDGGKMLVGSELPKSSNDFSAVANDDAEGVGRQPDPNSHIWILLPIKMPNCVE
ncbi:hypothetical protein HY604_00995 [Candidatus Peregrinibacteria bacterium]|nr:hypothetical protein [Candidatus Peregrinibacteria bacterium]